MSSDTRMSVGTTPFGGDAPPKLSVAIVRASPEAPASVDHLDDADAMIIDRDALHGVQRLIERGKGSDVLRSPSRLLRANHIGQVRHRDVLTGDLNDKSARRQVLVTVGSGRSKAEVEVACGSW